MKYMWLIKHQEVLEYSIMMFTSSIILLMCLLRSSIFKTLKSLRFMSRFKMISTVNSWETETAK